MLIHSYCSGILNFFFIIKKVLWLYHGIVVSDGNTIYSISWFWMITLVTYHGIYMVLKVLQTIPWYYHSAMSKKSRKYHNNNICNNILSHLMPMEWFLEFFYFIIYAERPSVMF